MRGKLLVLLIVLSSFLIGTTAFAEGDGTGGGKSEPLALVSSSINDGTTGVSLKPEIKLTFSKNIVNMTVIENNKKCFLLQTANGTAVPIDLFLADDQIDFEKRNDAVITPKGNLVQGTTYSVIISSSLKSKSGVTTGKETKITFTTEGAKSETNKDDSSKTTPKSETVAPKPETPSKPENKTNINTTSKAEEKPSTDSQPKTTENNPTVEQQPNVDTNEDEATVSEVATNKATPYEAVKTTKTKITEKHSSSSNTFIYVIVICVVAIFALGFIYFYRRKKK